MLQIEIPPQELWDEEKQEFIIGEKTTLRLEHSLVSLSKWESKHCQGFLKKKEKTIEETIDYIKAMTLDKDVKDEVYSRLTNENIKEVNDYIAAAMTATTISEHGGGRGGSEPVTAELIYYWMISLGIPFECQRWHLNRLLTLVRVCNVKNQKPKPRSRKEIASRNSALNAARRRQLNSRG
jgi:hypothetical protein